MKQIYVGSEYITQNSDTKYTNKIGYGIGSENQNCLTIFKIKVLKSGYHILRLKYSNSRIQLVKNR